jgi:NAD+ diphosphatase
MALGAITNTFAGNPLDRASELRGDRAALSKLLKAPGARALALWNGKPLVTGEDDPAIAWLPPRLAHELAVGEERMLFLGLMDGAAVFAVDLEGAADPVDGPLQGFGRFAGLRDIAQQLPGADAGVLATAKAVFEWRRRHGFCSACGQPTLVTDGGWKRVCEACRAEHFPRTDPVVIMLPTLGERCLLGRQRAWPAGMHSALAGFLEPGETIEEACAREVREEAGLSVTAVRYHSSQPWPFPNSLMIGLLAEVSDDNARPDQTELEAVRWFTRTETKALLRGEIEGVWSPRPSAIAHQLVKAWAEGG